MEPSRALSTAADIFDPPRVWSRVRSALASRRLGCWAAGVALLRDRGRTRQRMDLRRSLPSLPDPPTGVAVFPREMLLWPRSWTQRYHNLKRCTRMPSRRTLRSHGGAGAPGRRHPRLLFPASEKSRSDRDPPGAPGRERFAEPPPRARARAGARVSAVRSSTGPAHQECATSRWTKSAMCSAMIGDPSGEG
jgi:hypothetical protein